MHQPRGDAQLFSRFVGDACKQPCHVMFVQPVERASQAIVVEIFCLNPFTRAVAQVACVQSTAGPSTAVDC